jgi:hypothetical protein
LKAVLQNKRGLSAVVTTLIILVVSVLLAGVVTMYAINITSTRTQQEQLKLSNHHIWVDGNGSAYAAVAIDNVGGRDLVIDKIQVRGVETNWTSVQFLRLSSALSITLNAPNTSVTTVSWSDFEYTPGSSDAFTAGEFDLPLASGETLLVYIVSPESIALSDIGVTIGVSVFSQSAQYYVECNVETTESA